MGKLNNEEINNILINYLFKPLNNFLQEIQPEIAPFEYFNKSHELLAITFCDKFLIKIRMDKNMNEGTFNGVKIEIFHKPNKIDEELIMFNKPVSVVKKGPSSNQYIDDSINLNSFQVNQICSYIAQWFYFYHTIQSVSNE